jgi:hypothetical protein
MKLSHHGVHFGVALTNFVVSALPAAAATLTFDATEPTGASVVIANPHSFHTGSGTDFGPVGDRDTFTTAGATTSRGQSFLMPDNATGTAWDLASVTIRADATAATGSGVAQDFSGGATLRFWLFELAPSNDANSGAQWVAGDGISDGDPLDGTGVTNVLVNGQTFDATRNFSGEFMHFATPGLQVNENTAYGLLVSFTPSTGTTGLRLDQVRDNVTAPNGESYLNGAHFQSNDTANTFGSNGDDMVFYVEATAVVPEPAGAALFGLGSLALLRARRRLACQ